MSNILGVDKIDRMRARYTALGVLKAGDGMGVKSAVTAPAMAEETGRDRILRIVVTTDDVDLSEEVVDPKGANRDYLDANKSVFADHRYDLEFVLGTIRHTEPWPSAKNQRGFIQTINILRGTPLREEAWRLATTHGIGASIGFMSVRFDRPTPEDPPAWMKAVGVHREWRWLETSLTAMPCNVGCQSQVATEKEYGDVAEMVRKGLVSANNAGLLGWRPSRRLTLPRNVLRLT